MGGRRTLGAVKAVIVGQGYVGLPVAVHAAAAGFDVLGFDTDVRRVKRLNAGESIVDDVSDEDLRAALDSGRYRATHQADDLEGYDVAVISVPTPLRDGAPDMSHIEEAAATLGTHLKRGACVILESTTYPGTTEELVAPLLESASGLTVGHDFLLGYSPERIDPGNRVYTLRTTPKVVSGIDDESLSAVQSFYAAFVDVTVPVANTRVAELTKLLENTFRHVNIALVNEVAMFANDLGIDVWEVLAAANTKPFGYMRFTPGPGVGGHCLPIDPSYLSWRVRRSLGQPFRFVELANDINEHMPDYVLRRLVLAFNRRGLSVQGRRVLVLGMAYKKNTGDARESPALEVLRQLVSMGADVKVTDPYVEDRFVPTDVERVDCTPEEIAAADAIVLLVDHDAFDYDALTSAAYVFDCQHRVVQGANVEYL
ncbi:MAG: UDP-N-acetyl-D-glucosamine dehydrogenase [Acidimicrobiaceae bacterium]